MKKLYRIGLNPSCPVHHVTLGGQQFAKHSERVTGSGAETKRQPIDGHIVELSADDLKRCFKAAQGRVIRRTMGKRSRASIEMKERRDFVPYDTDLELAAFVYAEPVEDSPFKDKSYPTLAEALGHEAPEVDLGNDTPEKVATADELDRRRQELELRERELAYRERLAKVEAAEAEVAKAKAADDKEAEKASAVDKLKAKADEKKADEKAEAADKKPKDKRKKS